MIVILSWDYFPVSSYPDLMFNCHDADGLDMGPDTPYSLNGCLYGPTQPYNHFLCVYAYMCYSLSDLNIIMIPFQEQNTKPII